MPIYAPRQVRALPINLLRSQAYPPAPWVTQQGVQQYPQQGVTYMPQRMAFGKYKTPPAGYNQMAMGGSAVDVVQLSRQMQARTRKLAEVDLAAVPVQPIHTAADPYNQLPEASLDVDPQPLSRGLLTRTMVQPDTLLRQMAADITSDPVNASRGSYMMPRPTPPRFPDTYVVRRYATRTGDRP